MNENLRVGEQFFRIIREFEKAPPDCKQTEDGAALEAYLCPSNQYTLGFGCCFWHYDGRPVKEGDTLDPSQVGVMLAYNARYCEDYVRACVAVELTQNQFDALCSFRFNTRETTLRNSSRLLPSVNAQEWQKAAVAFTEFVYGTSSFDGKPYQEAMRGLLRRRLWESLIFLGLDPAEAVKDKDVALPSDRVLLSSGVYRDRIRSEGLTTVNQVKMKAPPLSSDLVLNTPAPPLATTGSTAVVGGVPTVPPVQVGTSPPPVKEPAKIEHDTADVSKIPPKVSPAPTDRVVPPVVATRKPEAIPAPPAAPRAPIPNLPSKFSVPIESAPYQIDQSLGLKPMESTERWQASLAQNGGKLLMRLARYGTFGAAPTTVATFVEKDPLFAGAFVAACGFAGLYAIGYVRKSYGDFCRHHAEKKASQAMV